MPEQQGAVPHHVIDQTMPIDIPLVGAGGPIDVHRERVDAPDVVVDARRHELPGTLEQGRGPGEALTILHGQP